MIEPVYILLIDDDAVDREAICRSWQEAGVCAEVHKAADAASGLRLLDLEVVGKLARDCRGTTADRTKPAAATECATCGTR